MWVRLPPRAPIFVFCFNLADALLRKLYEFCTRHLRSDDGIFSPSAGVRTTRPVKLAVPQGDRLDLFQNRFDRLLARRKIPDPAVFRGKKRYARERRDQFLRVWVLWRAKDLRWRTTFDNFAVIENRNAMTKRGNR